MSLQFLVKTMNRREKNEEAMKKETATTTTATTTTAAEEVLKEWKFSWISELSVCVCV